MCLRVAENADSAARQWAARERKLGSRGDVSDVWKRSGR